MKFNYPGGTLSIVLHTEKNQLRWFRYLVMMLPGSLPEQCSGCVQLGGDAVEDPGHTGENIYQLAWERLGILLEELEDMTVENDV